MENELFKLMTSKTPFVKVISKNKKDKKNAKKVEDILNWHMKNMIKDYYLYGK